MPKVKSRPNDRTHEYRHLQVYADHRCTLNPPAGTAIAPRTGAAGYSKRRGWQLIPPRAGPGLSLIHI